MGHDVLQTGLPVSNDAERFVLGTILLDDTAYPTVSARLSPRDFALHAHQLIFERMASLAKRGDPIDYLTLTTELENHGQLQSVDGMAYIASLTDGLPRLSSIDGYIRIVEEKADRRSLYALADQIQRGAIDEGQSVESVRALAQAELSAVRASKSGPKLVRQILEEGDVGAILNPASRGRGLETGFTDLDRLTCGLQPGELVVLAARPSMGKSALALDIARHVCRSGRRVILFSLEMSKESLLHRLLCAEGRIDLHRHRGGWLDSVERNRLSAALTTVRDLPLWIDDTLATNAMDLLSKARQIQADDDLSLVIVDYLGLMISERGENRNQEVSLISRALKLMAKELNVPVLALSQLSRAVEQRGGDRRPQLSDLRDSGSIEQDADVVGFIFREEVYKPDREDLSGVAELIISKQRNGPTGKVNLAWLRHFASFDNFVREEPDE